MRMDKSSYLRKTLQTLLISLWNIFGALFLYMRPHVFNEHTKALVCKEITCDNQFKEDGSIWDYSKGIFQSIKWMGNNDDDYIYLMICIIKFNYKCFMIFLYSYHVFCLLDWYFTTKYKNIINYPNYDIKMEDSCK